MEEKLDRIIALLECLVANERHENVVVTYPPVEDAHVLPVCTCDTGGNWCALHGFYGIY